MTVRLYAIGSVVRLGKPALLRHLIPLVKDPSGGVRVNALDALARMKVRGAERAILSALEDSKWYVRLSALRAAADLELVVPQGTLRGLERDPRPGVRSAAKAYRSSGA